MNEYFRIVFPVVFPDDGIRLAKNYPFALRNWFKKFVCLNLTKFSNFLCSIWTENLENSCHCHNSSNDKIGSEEKLKYFLDFFYASDVFIKFWIEFWLADYMVPNPPCRGRAERERDFRYKSVMQPQKRGNFYLISKWKTTSLQHNLSNVSHSIWTIS
jgi:hypothetical protein